MNSILVFCGSKTGNNPQYSIDAEKVGKVLCRKSIKMVYGGGGVGLMGIIARSMINAGGKVVGIIPDFLQGIEGIDLNLSELHLVKTMHERKVKMAEISDAVLVLPGGYGTLDELFELLTLVQLNQGKWPIGILNTNGYYNHLLAHIDLMVDQGFLHENYKAFIHVDDDPERLIEYLLNHIPVSTQNKIEIL